jgi:rhamnose utilization protein RhaD (predicted bifunctional aldolase and dehydrogenase)
MRIDCQQEYLQLRELTARVGSDPLLTQASTGNSSIKSDRTLWIKASGKWMTNAACDDIFIPLRLPDVLECLGSGMDPSERFPGASLETAMHALLPHRVVLHLHSINTIAWAVRKDAEEQLRARLDGLHWQWIPYVVSGLPLALDIQRAYSANPKSNIFVLGNHGLVVAGAHAGEVEALMNEVERRVAVRPRAAGPANYSVLAEICADSRWDLPDDESIHALATDTISQRILRKGLLYPCQAIFSGSDQFRTIEPQEYRSADYGDRLYLGIEAAGMVINKSARPAEIAILSGLAQVVQRLRASTPVRYLTRAELDGFSGQVAYRYRELANAVAPGSAVASQ